MKVGILAGGYGTRLAEETEIRPKPMVEIGGMPILWHIMMHYYHYGHREFAIALGYKGEYNCRRVRGSTSPTGKVRAATSAATSASKPVTGTLFGRMTRTGPTGSWT